MPMKCDGCGVEADASELDSLPTMTPALSGIYHSEGQVAMMEYAADHGFDFDRCLCQRCYGPGFNTI